MPDMMGSDSSDAATASRETSIDLTKCAVESEDQYDVGESQIAWAAKYLLTAPCR